MSPTPMPVIHDNNEIDADSCFLEYVNFDSRVELSSKRPNKTCDLDKDPLEAPASCTMDYGSTSSSFKQTCLNDVGGKFHFKNYSLVCSTLGNETTHPVTFNFVNNPACFPHSCSNDNIDELMLKMLLPIAEQKLEAQGSICEARDYGRSPTTLKNLTPAASPVKDNNSNPALDDTTPELDCTIDDVTVSSSCTMDVKPLISSYQKVCLNDAGGKIYFHDFTLSCIVIKNDTEYFVTLNFLNRPSCVAQSCSEHDIYTGIKEFFYPEVEEEFVAAGYTSCVATDLIVVTNSTPASAPSTSPNPVILPMTNKHGNDTTATTSLTSVALLGQNITNSATETSASIRTTMMIDMGMIMIGFGSLLVLLE
jgi:hypothetical protein